MTAETTSQLRLYGHNHEHDSIDAKTCPYPSRHYQCNDHRPYQRKLLWLTVGAAIVLSTACGSDSSPTDITGDSADTVAVSSTDEENRALNTQPNPFEPTSNGTDSELSTDEGPADDVQQDSPAPNLTDPESISPTVTEPANSTEDTSADNSVSTQPPVVELTPVALLFQEITLTALQPVLNLQRKLNSGESLTVDENACLGSWEPSLGTAVTAIDCENPLTVNSPILQVSSATFDDDSACQNAIRDGNGEGCKLIASSIEIRVQWIPRSLNSAGEKTHAPITDTQLNVLSTDQALEAMANIVPLAGTRISFDRQTDTATLGHTSTLTGAFQCHYRISDAREIFTDTTFGNCQTEMSRTINRLYELRVSE